MYFAYFHKLCSKMSEKWRKMTQKWLAHTQTWNFIFPSCPGIQNTCLCEFCSHLLYNCSRNFISSRLLRFFTFEIFPILTRVAQAFKNTMLNKSGYFRTPASMKKSTALDFWRKSEKPEMESYIIYHDFGKIQVKNTASYWILPYIYGPICYNSTFWSKVAENWKFLFGCHF